jgi:Na+/glutamate symporter
MNKTITKEVIIMPFWQRSLITLVAMVVVSFVVGYIWRSVFNFSLPDYVSGMVGGLTAVPLWEFLKRVQPPSS